MKFPANTTPQIITYYEKTINKIFHLNIKGILTKTQQFLISINEANFII